MNYSLFNPMNWFKKDFASTISNNRPLPRTYKKEIEELVLVRINITFYQRVGHPSYQAEVMPNQQLRVQNSGDALLVTVIKTNNEGNPLKTYHTFHKADIVVYTTEYETVKRFVEVRI